MVLLVGLGVAIKRDFFNNAIFVESGFIAQSISLECSISVSPSNNSRDQRIPSSMYTGVSQDFCVPAMLKRVAASIALSLMIQCNQAYAFVASYIVSIIAECVCPQIDFSNAPDFPLVFLLVI